MIDDPKEKFCGTENLFAEFDSVSREDLDRLGKMLGIDLSKSAEELLDEAVEELKKADEAELRLRRRIDELRRRGARQPKPKIH